MNRFFIFIVIFVSLPTIICAGDTTANRYDGAKYDPRDSTVETTYEMPEIDSGFTYDVNTDRMRGVLSVEFLDNANLPLTDYPMKSNFGTGEDLIFVSSTVRLTSIFEVSVGPFVGYDFNKNQHVVGVIGLVTEF